jgi:hypothetical protein
VLTGVLSSYLTLIVVFGSFSDKHFQNFDATTEFVKESMASELDMQFLFYKNQLHYIAKEVEAVESGDLNEFYRVTCEKLRFYVSSSLKLGSIQQKSEEFEESIQLFEKLSAQGFCNS